MADRAGRLSGVTLGMALAAGMLSSAGAVAQEAPGAQPFELGPGQVLRAEASPGVVTTTPTGRYPETIEFRRAPRGDLLVVADLDIETYVAGIAEMPARWPMEALKAQAVAARTYAWFQTQLGTFQRRGFGYDICATTACQVYRGAEVVETPLVGSRWQQAVDETAGEVLLHEGAPILARYFSTSGGLTWPNEVVFPSEGPRPYLVGGPDPDDAVSPLHTWEVTFTREQLDAILSRGRSLGSAVPFATIDDVPGEAEGRTAGVRVVGVDGTTVQVGAVAFRSFVSAVAPDLYPDDFPGPRGDGRRLPSTIPSSRFTIAAGPTDQLITLAGRGWGHGVGMGQYGALGKAERGLAYDEILAAYYNGLTPTRVAGLPERLRVGLQSTPNAVEVRFNGPTTLRADDTTIVDGAIGTWTITPTAADGLRATPPAGWGEPLELTATSASVTDPTPVEDVVLTATTNKSIEVVLEVTGPDGAVVATRALGVVDAGVVEHRWDLADGDGVALPPGTYAAALLGTDELASTAGEPVTIEVSGIGGPGLRRPRGLVPAPPPARPGPHPWLATLAGLLLGVATGRLVGELRVRREQAS